MAREQNEPEALTRSDLVDERQCGDFEVRFILAAHSSADFEIISHTRSLDLLVSLSIAKFVR